MEKIKDSGDKVKPINMLHPKMSKQITPLKILLDDDLDIRTTTFPGTTNQEGPTFLPKLYLLERLKVKEASTSAL